MHRETVFRTIKVKLTGNIEPLLKTAIMYTQVCQLALDYGFKNKTYNKNKNNAGTYRRVREQLLPLLYLLHWYSVLETRPQRYSNVKGAECFQQKSSGR
jgi:hypothetical protein